VIAASVRRSLYEETSELTPAVIQLVSFAIVLLSQAYLARMVDAAPNHALGDFTGHYASFLLLGMALLDLQHTVIGGLGRRIRQAQVQGSLESLLATPTPTWLVLLALSVPDVLWALGRMGIYALAGWLLFDLHFATVNLLGLLVILFAALLGFAAFTLIGAAITMLLRRADPLNLLVAAASMIAGGVFYPRTILPHWLALAGDVLPIVPALDGLREAMLHAAGPLALAGPLGRLGLMVLVVGPIGAWLFSRMLARAREDGSLTSY
jgi:ABC-2 type transport system permease protein